LIGLKSKIPNVWKLVPFEELAIITNGQVDPKKKPFSEMILLGSDHIREGGGLVSSLTTASEQAAISGKYIFRIGQVVYSKIRPNLNKVYFADFDGLCSADIYPIDFSNSQITPKFAYHVMLGEGFYKSAVAASMRSGIPKVNRDDLASIEVCVPPLEQQKRIVAVLDAWDQAIEQTERLIAAKRQRKTALFQKLFRNLPKRPLLEAADVWFSGVDKKSRADEAPVLLCNYMDVFHNSRITSSIDFMRATASRNQIAVNTLRKHDVVFTKDSETSEEIAEPALVDADIPNLVCGYHLAVARPRDGVGYGPFIAQAMRHQAIRWQFNRLANGVVRFGLTLDAIEQAEIFLPSMVVQERIAAVLDAEDILIDELKRSAETFRTQKRGLMQKLLTGEWQLGEKF
jgi:type I restriction enzyme, S subunit